MSTTATERCPCGREAGHDADRDHCVSLRRDWTGTAMLLGPYESHELALIWVDLGHQLAEKADPWAAFDAVGTCSLPKGHACRVVFGKDGAA